MAIVRPFLRWAGGKSWLLSQLKDYLPTEFNNYHEPFLGGGSIFIYLKSNNLIKNESFLSDLNGELINSYNVIKYHHSELIDLLHEHKNEKEYYYQVRLKKFDSRIDSAAQFLYLNRTSFNGIYRVNLKGVYNVPFGYRDIGDIVDSENITSLNAIFQNSNFYEQDFEKSLNRINEHDLVILDPPYTVAHENNGFVKYNQKIFSWDDQLRLKRFIEALIDKKAYYIVTNAAHSSISKLYENFKDKIILDRKSLIGGKGARRTTYHEFLYHNSSDKII